MDLEFNWQDVTPQDPVALEADLRAELQRPLTPARYRRILVLLDDVGMTRARRIVAEELRRTRETPGRRT